MPETTSSPVRPARRRVLIRGAAVLGTLLALGGGVAAATTAAQSAGAEESERRILTQLLDDTSSVRPEQLDAYDAIAEQRIAYSEQLAAEAEARAAYLLTPAGAQETARDLASRTYGWGDDQFSCLVSLWGRESGWSYSAYNASSGATGIPQALPGEKMAVMGDDWQTNPATQIAWGLAYISGSYGTPCAAWGHSESYNWY